MKRLLLILPFLIILFSHTIYAQCQWLVDEDYDWKSLGSEIAEPGRNIYGISVVDEQTIWGFTSGSPSLSEFARTTDGGITWASGEINVNPVYQPTQIHAINDMVAWVATTDFSGSGRIYKTTDGGLSWTEQSTAFAGLNEVPMGIYFWDEQVGVAFGGRPFGNFEDQISIYTTENGGDLWTKVIEPNIPPQEVGEGILPNGGNGFFTVVDDYIWFVTLSDKLYRSADRGKTWTTQTTGFPHPFGWASVAFKDTLNGIVVNWDPVQAARTTDGGENWTLIDNNVIPSSPEAAQIEYIPGTDGTYIFHDAYWDGDISLPAKLAITCDDGESWEVRNMNLINPLCLDFIADSLGFAGGEIIGPGSDEGGFFRWDLINSTPEIATRPLTISPNPVDRHLFIQLPGYTLGQHYTVEIYDLKGRLLRQGIARDTAEPFDMGGLPAGVYLIKAFTKKIAWSGKVVKR